MGKVGEGAIAVEVVAIAVLFVITERSGTNMGRIIVPIVMGITTMRNIHVGLVGVQGLSLVLKQSIAGYVLDQEL